MSWYAGFAAYCRAERREPVHRPHLEQVYCISEGYGQPAKIGITSDLRVRHENFRSATYRNVQICWAADGTRLHERAIKRLMVGSNLRGEWFADANDALKLMLPPTADQIALEAAIDALAERLGFPSFYGERQKRRPPEPVQWLPRRPQVAA